jgi:hypothetical protein
MNNQCLRFPLLMHLFKGLNITREGERERERKTKKQKQKKP